MFHTERRSRNTLIIIILINLNELHDLNTLWIRELTLDKFLDRLKEEGVEKGSGLHPTLCVQADKYWYCFEGNLGADC